jgi:hypothetical protein
MSLTKSRRASFALSRMELWTALGLTLVLLFFIGSGVIAYRNVEMLRTNSQQIWHTHNVLMAIDELLSTTQDAETGQRGYLLTGNDRYLEPYQAAVADVISRTDTIARSRRTTQSSRTTWPRSGATSTPSSPSWTRPSPCAEAARPGGARRRDHRPRQGRDGRDPQQLDVMRQEENRLRDIRLGEMDTAYGRLCSAACCPACSARR